MTGAITFEFVATVFAVLVGAGWLWRAFTNKTAEIQREMRAEILKVKTEQSALQLQVARDYASVQHLEKVEGRLVNAIDRLIDEVKGLREAVSQARSKN